MEKIKLYTKRSWLPNDKKHITLLIPFWGDVDSDQSDPDYGRFYDFANLPDYNFILEDDINKSDFIVMPYEYTVEVEYTNITKNIIKESMKTGKKILIFYNSDFTNNIDVPNSIVFRTSFYRSTKREDEYALPGWSHDYRGIVQNRCIYLEKANIPKISYCGYIDYLEKGNFNFKQRLNHSFNSRRKIKDNFGPRLRGKAVRNLYFKSGIEADFIIREGFWGHISTDRNPSRLEFIENLYGSPYALVTRGAGNFSYRFYEVLSAGRIPVFINTDCVLPYDDIINWKDYIIWIEENEIRKIANILKKIP